jgi:hypothetical protein
MSASPTSTDPEDASSPTIVPLEDQIANGYVYSEFPVDAAKQPFLPDGELDKLITNDSVIQELDLADGAESELIEFICQPAKKVFANALISGLGGQNLRKAMSKFKRHGFCDKSLPVGPEFEKLSCVSIPPWSKMKIRYFRDNQWKFLAPVFPNPAPDKDLKLVLEPEHILPFTYVDEQSREGTFGNVYQVTIHPSHQEVPMKKVSDYHIHMRRRHASAKRWWFSSST